MKRGPFIFFSLMSLSGFFISCDFTPRLHKKILLAQEEISLQRYDKAVLRYEGILKSNPPKDIQIKIYYQLGEIYSNQLAKYSKALEYYGLVKEISQDPLWLVKSEEKVGEINFFYTKDYKESVKNYTRLFEFRPKLDKSDFYQYRLALSYFQMSDMDKSLEEFKRIQENKNNKYHVKSFYYLGMIYFQTKKWKKAIRYWQEYIKRENRRDSIVQTKFLVANAYETMEQLKKAYNIYYSILGEYPNTEVLKNRLNAIYARKIARKR